jgi:Crp-like helix-turn-helix domain
MIDCWNECEKHQEVLSLLHSSRTTLLTPSSSPKDNALLAALPPAAYRRLLPDLEAATLTEDEVLFQPTGRPQFAYFPTRSTVSLMYAADAAGAMAKAWPVGREGMVGISLFLGVDRLDSQAKVQLGGAAFRLPSSALLVEFRRASALQQLLLRYAFALITQASQLGLCNHLHTVDQRLCRFLQRTFDRTGEPQIELTQGRIGELLGVRRVSITQAAMALQREGVIQYVRGRVRLLDRRKLEQRSCICASVIAQAFAAVTA